MEESHFNSNPYFWPSIPTVSGQIENTMFINKMKDQLLPEKGCGLAPPHYPTLLTVPASVSLPSGISMDTESKSDQLTPHSQASVTQNITVVPVPSTGLMTAGVSCSQRWRREGSQSRGPGLVITSPSGSLVTTASSAQTFPISAPMIVSALPPGSQALQVVPDLSKKVASTLTEEGGGGGGGGGNVAPKPPRGRKKKRMLESGLPEMNDPYVLSPEDDDDHQKDGKTYRCRMCSLTSTQSRRCRSLQVTQPRPSPTSAHIVPRPSPTAPTWPSTSVYTQGLSPIVVTSVRNPSASFPPSAAHPGSTPRCTRRPSSPTSARTAPRPSPTPPTWPSTSVSTRGPSPTTVPTARRPSASSPTSSSTHESTPVDRPYKCAHPGCEKAFTQLSNLQSHRRAAQ
uniref:C2H2-type domain-containing protein n=1 Tax=Sciurus vulgaris TaxID=55149 RepID=A0A8D2DDF2_SCIVU